MKKILLLAIGLILAQLAMAQTVVVLDLPNPCSGTGVEEWKQQQSSLLFEVYPNPADDCVTLSVSTSSAVLGKMQVEVADLTGRLLLRQEYYSSHDKIQTLLELSALDSGAYLVTVRNENGRSTKRIIKK